MVAYFDDYVRRQRIRLALGVNVIRVDRDRDGWRVVTGDGWLRAVAVVIATGNYHTPTLPDWPGIETFEGEMLHSEHYRNAEPFAGRGGR